MLRNCLEMRLGIKCNFNTYLNVEAVVLNEENSDIIHLLNSADIINNHYHVPCMIMHELLSNSLIVTHRF